MKILVAEDDLPTRQILSKALREGGYEVLLATDGLKAKALLEKHPDVALVLTDVVMPNLDGRQLVRQIRAEPRHAALPILVMSAQAGTEEVERLLSLGASRFLPKPLVPDEIRSQVAALLEPGAGGVDSGLRPLGEAGNDASDGD